MQQANALATTANDLISYTLLVEAIVALTITAINASNTPSPSGTPIESAQPCVL